MSPHLKGIKTNAEDAGKPHLVFFHECFLGIADSYVTIIIFGHK